MQDKNAGIQGQENDGMQKLALFGKINPSNLKQNQYTILLLNEALRVNLLSRQEVRDIQLQIVPILKELILRHTKGESSSVTVDTAEKLLNSALYCIDAYTLSCDSAETAVAQLQTQPLRKLYGKGIKQVTQWVDETRRLYGQIRKNRLKVGLETYDLTIMEGIPPFFGNYNMLFDAQNSIASIDYPLALDDMSIQGALYMKNYLQHLKIETDFCRFFIEPDIEKLLKNFGRMMRSDYRIEIINLFELTFNNAVFSILSGCAVPDLAISEFQFRLLQNRLNHSDTEAAAATIRKAIEKMIRILRIEETDLLNYIERYESNFIPRVINALKNNGLEGIVVVEGDDGTDANTLLFNEEERMSSGAFQLLVQNILRLENPDQKAELIISSVRSLHDFIDIMTSDCLYGDDFAVLFDSLGNMELAVLTRIVFYEELRECVSELSLVVSEEADRYDEWQTCFAEYIRKLDGERIKTIEACLNQIDYEEIKFN